LRWGFALRSQKHYGLRRFVAVKDASCLAPPGTDPYGRNSPIRLLSDCFDRTRDISERSAQEIADAAKAWGETDDITVATIHRIASSRCQGDFLSYSQLATPWQ
jgi:hypothetical protein